MQTVVTTGVSASLVQPSGAEWQEVWPDLSERRRIERGVENGRVVLVMSQLFAELRDTVGVGRVGGTVWGPAVIALDRDPTKELVEQAYDGRCHLGDLYRDVKPLASRTPRWDLYAAPFRLELGPALEALLRPLMPSS